MESPYINSVTSLFPSDKFALDIEGTYFSAASMIRSGKEMKFGHILDVDV